MTNKVTFDDKGNPAPYEVIKLTHTEFEQIFVDSFKDSSTRTKIFAGHQQYNKNLSNLIKSNYFQIADGSFTTNKKNPNDIDVVSFMSYLAIDNHEESLKEFQTKHDSKTKYSVDGYLVAVYPKDHFLFNMITKKYLDYWYKWFGHDRQDNPKH